MKGIRNDDGNGGCKIRSGYRIYGPTSMGGMHLWCCDSLERARELAEFWVSEHGGEYEIMKYVGSVEVVRPTPVKWISASDTLPVPATAASEEAKVCVHCGGTGATEHNGIDRTCTECKGTGTPAGVAADSGERATS